MVHTNDAISTRYLWQQPAAFQRVYELLDGSIFTGSLRFEKRTSTSAIARFGGRQWSFQRTGFWHPKVVIREGQTESGCFTPKIMGGGELVLPGGRQLSLKATSFWHSEWTFENEGGLPLVSLQGPRGLVKHHGETVVH